MGSTDGWNASAGPLASLVAKFETASIFQRYSNPSIIHTAVTKPKRGAGSLFSRSFFYWEQNQTKKIEARQAFVQILDEPRSHFLSIAERRDMFEDKRSDDATGKLQTQYNLLQTLILIQHRCLFHGLPCEDKDLQETCARYGTHLRGSRLTNPLTAAQRRVIFYLRNIEARIPHGIRINCNVNLRIFCTTIEKSSTALGMGVSLGVRERGTRAIPNVSQVALVMSRMM